MTAQQPGYRGARTPRNDALARPWVLVVIGIFVLMFVLAFLGFPTSLGQQAGASVQPSFAVPSGAATGSASVIPSASP
jgi:hypothetical protein